MSLYRSENSAIRKIYYSRMKFLHTYTHTRALSKPGTRFLPFHHGDCEEFADDWSIKITPHNIITKANAQDIRKESRKRLSIRWVLRVSPRTHSYLPFSPPPPPPPHTHPPINRLMCWFELPKEKGGKKRKRKKKSAGDDLETTQ